MKRSIEASVLDVRGEAAQRDLGDEAEAYADFLACALCSQSQAAGSNMAKLAVIVIASSSTTVDVYEGPDYAAQPQAQRVANLSVICRLRNTA